MTSSEIFLQGLRIVFKDYMSLLFSYIDYYKYKRVETGRLAWKMLLFMVPGIVVLLVGASMKDATVKDTLMPIGGVVMLVGVILMLVRAVVMTYEAALSFNLLKRYPGMEVQWYTARSKQLMRGHKLSLFVADIIYILISLVIIVGDIVLMAMNDISKDSSMYFVYLAPAILSIFLILPFMRANNEALCEHLCRKSEQDDEHTTADDTDQRDPHIGNEYATTYKTDHSDLHLDNGPSRSTMAKIIGLLLIGFGVLTTYVTRDTWGPILSQALKSDSEEPVKRTIQAPKQQKVEEADEEIVIAQGQNDDVDYIIIDGKLVREDEALGKRSQTVKVRKTNNVSEMKAGEAVDLGLSVRWCSSNVGAGKVSDHGNLLTWDKVQPTDGWRLPTFDEQRELIMGCTWKYCAVGGNDGFKVTGPNGNSIFLPSAGYIKSGTLRNKGTHGYYWSTDCEMGGATKAQYMFFLNRETSPTRQGLIERNVSMSVRLVKAK